ncbi:hypothetical protein XELAEV_18035019mg [Xenopus laevis]|uniref:Uncharacterized protein n=1 Tax=Xenopus laevis TaxID=8355 RepID=A0A974CEY2_XENLA|nr:hypothetical protein XELAEV_18035019mg [Xenopus laevis]
MDKSGKIVSPIPRKLSEFYEEEIQDGARYHKHRDQDDPSFHTPSPLPQKNRFSPLFTPHRKTDPADLEEDSEEEQPRDRSTLKPTRSQPAPDRQEDSESQVGQNLQPPPHPTPTKQPMMQKFFKEFMMSFRCVIQDNMAEVRGDMKTLMGHMSHFAKEIDLRVTKLENRIAEMTVAHNELVDAHRELMGEAKWMKEKIANGEDRNRRNNVKLRGVPESVSNDDLKGYVKDLLKTTFPSLSESELTVDRAHRLPKPEMLLAATRGGKKLQDPFRDLSLYQDLSQGISHVIRSVKEGQELLAKWNIPIFTPRDPRRDRPIHQPPLSKQQPMDTSQPQTEKEKSLVAPAGT